MEIIGRAHDYSPEIFKKAGSSLLTCLKKKSL